jgi:hypothetical protein
MRGSTPCSWRATIIFGDGSTNRKTASSLTGAPPMAIDLLDFAALMTLRPGGSVTLVAPEALPPPGLSTAILRY